MATGLIHEREFSRKTFLKGGGALVVGFSFAGLAGTARAADSPFASSGPPDVAQIDTWLTIHADNTATLRSGIVELGQGSATGLLQIAAEELDLDFAQLRWTRHDTNVTPNQGTTSASIGIKVGGLAVRGAAAVAAQTLRNLAATQLGIPAASLTVSKGVVSGGGKSVSYGQLIGDKLFNVSMPASMNMTIANVATGRNTTIGLRPGALPAKPTASYRLVGTSVPRIDIPDKATGRFTYVHNIRVPGMVHGRIVWQRGQGNYGTADQIVSIDESSLKSIPGAQIVRKGNFLGVVAPTEYDAIQAAAQLKVKWAARQAMGGSGNLYGTMRQHEAAGLTTSITAVNTGNVDAALASAAKVVSATYSFPFNGHLPIGPDCCVADVTSSGAVIYSGTQDAYVARQRVATVTGLPQDVIRVVYYESSSSYGSGAPKNDELVEAAALMSQLVGKPVRLQFMRWDEHGYDRYANPGLMDIRGGLDANGRIVAFDYKVYALPTSGTTETVLQLLGAPLAPSPTLASNVETSIIGVQYSIPNWRVVAKSLPNFNNGYPKVGYVRSVQAQAQGWGSLQMFDELAHAANMDPVAFHRLNLPTVDLPPDNNGSVVTPKRWSAVLDAVVRASNWTPKVSASRLSKADVVTGRGLAFGARYTGSSPALGAAVADVEVNRKTGKIVVKHIYTVQDYGLVIGPDLVTNQAQGQAIQSTSRVLSEEVRFDKNGVTSLDWVSYPVLRFKDHPNHTHVVITNPDQGTAPSSEELMPTVGAAIGNAFFDATGVRMRQAPLTPAKVRTALKATGEGG